MKALMSFILFALTLPVIGHATPVVDQTTVPPVLNNPFFTQSNFGGPIQQAQTFRVGITGTLVELDLLGFGSNSFSLDIRGQTASHPDNAKVLETVNVGGFAGGGALTHVTLNLPVTANELLSLVIYGGTAAPFSQYVNGIQNATYPYGSLWTFGNPPFGVDGPGTWYPNGAGDQEVDLIFRTYVDVPEPGTLGLMIFGLVGVLTWTLLRRVLLPGMHVALSLPALRVGPGIGDLHDIEAGHGEHPDLRGVGAEAAPE